MNYPEMYYAGRLAQDRGESRDSCPHSILDMFSRCWWMAGYNDRAQEQRRTAA